MATDPKIIPKIKIDFEAGKLSQVDIAKKWKIGRETLRRLANKNSWEYGVMRQEWGRAIEKNGAVKFIEREGDLSAQVTSEFLHSVSRIGLFEQRVYDYIAEHPKIPSQAKSKQLFEFVKLLKIMTDKALLAYQGQRVALGMDQQKVKDPLADFKTTLDGVYKTLKGKSTGDLKDLQSGIQGKLELIEDEIRKGEDV
jgi:hypothetical protein